MVRWTLAAATLSALLVSGVALADTLVVCSEASPDYMNPQFTTANTAYDVAAQIYDRLVELERGGSTVIPALAESWTVSEDGLTYTFHLRKGVHWQSNKLFKPTRDFNADDVVFSFHRMMDKTNPYYAIGGTGYQYFGSLVEPSIKSIEKTDDYTVVFTLKTPLAALLPSLSVEPVSILSAEYADAMMKAGTPDNLNQLPVGTGAFSLVVYQKDSEIRFKAFPEHWARAAKLDDRIAKVDDLVFSITTDATVRYAKLQRGECHIARYPAPGDLDRIRSDPAVTLLQSSGADMSYLSFNNEKKPFNDRRVREALVYASNIPNIIKAVYQTTGIQTAAMVPPTLWSHHDGLQPRPYDPEKAKALLAEAGYPNGFKTTLWALPVTRGYMPNGRRAAELLQADWAKIGVEAQIIDLRMGRVSEARPRGRARHRHARQYLGLSRSDADPDVGLDVRRDQVRRQPRALVQQGIQRRRRQGERQQRQGGAHPPLPPRPGDLPGGCRRHALRQCPDLHADPKERRRLQDPRLRRPALFRRVSREVALFRSASSCSRAGRRGSARSPRCRGRHSGS